MPAGIVRRLEAFFPQPPPSGCTGDPGLFGPASAAWRIGRERILLAAGPAALLLQLAHPLVAEGVRAHSNFTADPLRRLRGTLDAVLTITFGDAEQVRAAARYVGRRHRPVHGILPDASGSMPAGTPYRADDPDLALWVFATLVWTAVNVTSGFARPVPTPERDAYYRDMTALAHQFGVPPSALPEDYSGLEAYVEDQVRRVLSVGPTASALARQILSPDPPILAPPARAAAVLLAAGVLPPAVREAYGLPWRIRDRAVLRAVRLASRLTLPLLPARPRYWPHYRVAVSRMSPER
ncbi:oxygenase MpaB family protein [Arthrobacter sp. TMN-37]